MPKKKPEKFCSPENYSIIIPYKDFAKLMELPQIIDDMNQKVKRMEERNAAMYNMYSELLEKMAEINRLL